VKKEIPPVNTRPTPGLSKVAWLPRFEEVKVYFSQKGFSDQEAKDFFHFYEKQHWTSCKGKAIRNWKKFAYKWIVRIWKDDPLSFDKWNI
jgi:hypothetical protein